MTLYEEWKKKAETSAFWRYCIEEIDEMIKIEIKHERGEQQDELFFPIYAISLPYSMYDFMYQWRKGNFTDRICQIFFDTFFIAFTSPYLVISTVMRIFKLPYEIGRILKIKLQIKREIKKKRLEEEEKRIYNDSNRKRELYYLTSQHIVIYGDMHRRSILQEFARYNPEKSAEEVFELYNFYTSENTLFSDV